MKKSEGCHFYINIFNLDEVVTAEEEHTGQVNHSIHALDTFFSSIESYGKRKYPGAFYVEKVTGSRLHMYILEDVPAVFNILVDISSYAYFLTATINNEIPKYKKLNAFNIHVGCCYGKFYAFTFRTEGFEEETSIGYAANYAAKLQGITKPGFISISENIYEELSVKDKALFEKRTDYRIRKYDQECYYTTKLLALSPEFDFTDELKNVREYANGLNLTDIQFGNAYKQINFDNLSKKECKKVKGIPLFADVRGFTDRFKEDDSNLEEMATLTQSVLLSMYNIVAKKGRHVQFQGDREFALYHNLTEYNCCMDAVTAGMRIIDAVKGYGVCVGVGQSLGNLFVSKIGARGEKDNIVIGKTVTEADYFEDQCAEKNQLVISKEVYSELYDNNAVLARQFRARGNYYYTTVGYDAFKNNAALEQLKENNKNNSYNGAWGPDHE